MGRGRQIVMASMAKKGSRNGDEFTSPHQVMEEGNSTSVVIENFLDEIEVVTDPGADSSSDVLCANCSPCRIRVNIVMLLLLFLFSAGAALGSFTRPTSSSSSDIFSSSPNDTDDGTTATPFADNNGNSNNDNNSNDNKLDDDDGDNNSFFNEMDDDGYSLPVNSPYLVGVYYYPWHGNNFHNGEGYLRNQLQPPQEPALGEYDDSKPETIAQHLKWSRQANIGLWVTSWWGPDTVEDKNTRDVIMQHQDLGDMKIALHYETAGRIENKDTSNVGNDIEYICQTYFSNPNYYRIEGRPVLVMYITRELGNLGILEETLQLIRSTSSGCGHDIYIIGDHVFEDAPNPSGTFTAFDQLDAVTNYDVYGSMGRPIKYAGTGPIDDYYREQQKWRSLAIINGCRYIPAASPGYNDRGVRLQSEHPPLARRLSATSEEGSLFRYQLGQALPLVDPKVNNMILINSFNEWHEDTQIEPVIGTASSLPVHLTGGLRYEGYGELYLDILREYTSTNFGTVFKSSGDGN